VDQIAIKVHEDTPEDGDMLANSMDRGTPFGRPISPSGPVAFQEASKTCHSILVQTDRLLFSVPSGRLVVFWLKPPFKLLFLLGLCFSLLFFLVHGFRLLFLLGCVILVYVNFFYALASKPINTSLDPLEKQFIIIIEFI
jgi:hypothetical protein